MNQVFADLALARRLEAAEGRGNAAFVDAHARIDPASGATDIIISSFSPADALHQPHDATHFRVVTAALSFLPGRRKALAHIEQSELTPCNATSFPSINVRLQPPTECASVILSGICIIFYGQVRRKFKHLPESAFAITKTCQLPLS